MDSGSPAAEGLIEAEGALERLADSKGARFENIDTARRRSHERLESVRADLGHEFNGESAALVMFGSWARAEIVDGSDNDWAVLAHDPKAVGPLLERCRARFGDEPPGEQAIFGVPFSGDELTEQVGLELDTNQRLTRRILVLIESVTASGQLHEETRSNILRKYLSRNNKDRPQPPRFLLNELLRYWRTICVDYEGKYWGPIPDPKKRVLRNAKLRTSRKMLIAGALLPVLLCHRIERKHVEDYLLAQFRAAPTDNVAAAFLSVKGMEEAGSRTLLAYDHWIGLIGQEANRRALAELTEEEQRDSSLFNEVRDIGKELEEGLEALLFESSLAETSRKFGIF